MPPVYTPPIPFTDLVRQRLNWPDYVPGSFEASQRARQILQGLRDQGMNDEDIAEALAEYAETGNSDALPADILAELGESDRLVDLLTEQIASDQDTPGGTEAPAVVAPATPDPRQGRANQGNDFDEEASDTSGIDPASGQPTGPAGTYNSDAFDPEGNPLGLLGDVALGALTGGIGPVVSGMIAKGGYNMARQFNPNLPEVQTFTGLLSSLFGNELEATGKDATSVAQDTQSFEDLSGAAEDAAQAAADEEAAAEEVSGDQHGIADAGGGDTSDNGGLGGPGGDTDDDDSGDSAGGGGEFYKGGLVTRKYHGGGLVSGKRKFHGGGLVTAEGLEGPDPIGPDDGTTKAKLDIGEFVIRKDAVKALPKGLLTALNQADRLKKQAGRRKKAPRRRKGLMDILGG